MRDIVFMALFSLLVGGTEGPSAVPTCTDTQSSIVLWLYCANRNGTGSPCLDWSIKWTDGGQSSALLRPLFAIPFIELINKAPVLFLPPP